MIFLYTGAGYLVFILFVSPLIVLGWILYKYFGDYVTQGCRVRSNPGLKLANAFGVIVIEFVSLIPPGPKTFELPIIDELVKLTRRRD